MYLKKIIFSVKGIFCMIKNICAKWLFFQRKEYFICKRFILYGENKLSAKGLFYLLKVYFVRKKVIPRTVYYMQNKFYLYSLIQHIFFIILSTYYKKYTILHFSYFLNRYKICYINSTIWNLLCTVPTPSGCSGTHRWNRWCTSQTACESGRGKS